MVKAHGRGKLGEVTEYEYQIPEETETIRTSGGFLYPNSSGFAYEAAVVARFISKGLKEAPQYTLDETLTTMRLIS